MAEITGYRAVRSGVRLFTRRWPASGKLRSAVVIVHGLSEHCGRYAHVAEALASRGHDVRGSDLRGYGASEGTRAYIERFGEYSDDLVGDIESARALGVPVVLMGHSMGGLIALDYATGRHPLPDLVVLSAPALDNTLPPAKKALARILGSILPQMAIDPGVRGHQLSRDPAVGERYFADPLVHARTTFRLGKEGLRAAARLRRSIDRLAIPTLVIHSEQDRLIPLAATEPLGRLAVCDRVVFPDFRHESFNEEGGALAIATVADWVEARL